MEKLSKMWQKKSKFERVTFLLIMVLSCCILILSAIGLADLVDISITNSIMIPMLGIVFLLNGLTTYKQNKLAGIIILIGTGFIFLCCISVLIKRFLM